jgi:replication factor C large subunit
MLLVGPEGSGKTSSVYAIAKARNYEVLEINASDKRNAESIKSIVGSASKQMNLFSKNKIILIDEVDGLSGNNDRGGVKEINSILKSTYYPIILTANDEYSSKLEGVKTNSIVVKFKKRSFWDVYKLAKLVSENEGKNLSTVSLKKIASISQGDVRSAFNDLENVENDSDVDELYERIKKANIFDVLKIVFKSKTFESLLKSSDELRDMDIKDLVIWIGENIPNEYEKTHEIRDAYNQISRSDVFLGRIGRRMYWRFLVYAKLLCTLGVGLSKDEMYHKFSKYKPPLKFTNMAKNAKVRAENKAMSAEIAPTLHCSSKKFLSEYMQHYKLWIKE